MAPALVTPPQARVPATSPPAPDPLCDRIQAGIEVALKEIAYNSLSGFLDNSAPRETNRQTKINGYWQSIEVQLLHANALRCPAPTRLLVWDAYKRAALFCYTEERASRGREACDRNSWLRDEDMPPASPSASDAALPSR